MSVRPESILEFNNRDMDRSFIIFLVWVLMFIVSIIASINKSKKKAEEQAARKKAQSQQPRPRQATRPQADATSTTVNWQQTTTAPKAAAGTAAGRFKAEKLGSQETILAEEGTSAIKAKSNNLDSEAGEKGLDLDFDPVKMVIYSEVMEAGHEKY